MSVDAPRSLRINWILLRAGLAGGVRTIVQLARAMDRRGHENRIVYTPSLPWPRPWHYREFAERVSRAWELRGKQRTHLPGGSEAVETVRVRGSIVGPDDAPDADVTIGTWWPTMEWIRDWPDTKGLKVYYVQGHETHTGPVDRIHATYLQPSMKLVVASWLQKVMAEEYGDPNAVLIPNAIDWDQFDSRARRKPAVPTIGFLYSPRDCKDMPAAFEALRIVRRSIPELRVVSFGEWSPKRGESKGVPFHFQLRPPQDQLPQLYGECSCWLLSSKSEGFGLSGLEAAASHCPVVATRCGGPEDYIRDGDSGHLVDIGNPEALAERLIRVLALPDERWSAMSQAAYDIARSFTWDVSAKLLEEALLERKELAP